MEALDNAWYGSWWPLTNLTQSFQACHLYTFNVAAILFQGHPYTWRTIISHDIIQLLKYSLIPRILSRKAGREPNNSDTVESEHYLSHYAERSIPWWVEHRWVSPYILAKAKMGLVKSFTTEQPHQSPVKTEQLHVPIVVKMESEVHNMCPCSTFGELQNWATKLSYLR